MAVPVLKLNLAPPSNLWSIHHVLLSWAALGLGALMLAGTLGLTALSYRQAATSSKRVARYSADARLAAADYARIMDQLRSIDVAKELPRWRLAERIITERSLPWSRLTAELERSLVTDVRLRAVQRTRGADRKVQLKLKGEARSRAAEAEFVDSLQKNPFFEQVILERESERQGGGVDFDYTLAAASTPPPYKPLPKYGPKPKAKPGAAVPAKGVAPGRTGAAAPVRPGPAASAPARPGAPPPARPGAPPPAPVRSGVAVPPPPAVPLDPEATPPRSGRNQMLRRTSPVVVAPPATGQPGPASPPPDASPEAPSNVGRPRPGMQQETTP